MVPKNVVVPYVNEVILEAERYAGKEPSYGEIEVPTSNWTSRTDIGPLEDPVKLGYESRGMSYSFGGKMNVTDFNNTVAQSAACEAPVAPSITAFYVDPKNPAQAKYDKALARAAVIKDAHAIDPTYEGDLQIVHDDAGASLCMTGSGKNYYKYAGLKQHEKESSESYKIIGYYDDTTKQTVPVLETPDMTTNVLSYYQPEHWAGIDCSGLVQRSITRANKLEISGVKSEVKDLGSIGSCPADDEDCKPCGDPTIWSQSYMPKYARSIGNTAGQVTTADIKKARKGDVVVYPRHIAVVYSDNPTCQGDSCTYEIIHAYGRDSVDLGTPANPFPVFTRKVRTNLNTEPKMPTPTGFGRIKLWD